MITNRSSNSSAWADLDRVVRADELAPLEQQLKLLVVPVQLRRLDRVAPLDVVCKKTRASLNAIRTSCFRVQHQLRLTVVVVEHAQRKVPLENVSARLDGQTSRQKSNFLPKSLDVDETLHLQSATHS